MCNRNTDQYALVTTTYPECDSLVVMHFYTFRFWYSPAEIMTVKSDMKSTTQQVRVTSESIVVGQRVGVTVRVVESVGDRVDDQLGGGRTDASQGDSH